MKLKELLKELKYKPNYDYEVVALVGDKGEVRKIYGTLVDPDKKIVYIDVGEENLN